MAYRRNVNFLIFLGISLALHAGLMVTVASPLVSRLLGFRHTQSAPREFTVALVPPKLEDEPDMGEDKAKGIGSNKSDGDQMLQAREADEDQAFLSRDPRGPGRVGNEPAPNTAPLGEGGMGGQVGGSPDVGVKAGQVGSIANPPIAPQPQAASVPEPPVPAPVVHLPDTGDLALPDAVAIAPIAPQVEIPKVSAPAAQKPAQQKAAAGPARPATGDQHAPGRAVAQADPAQQSDSESDPFSRLGSAIYRDGRLEVRSGRKVRTTRPHILLAGTVDLFSMGGASVVLKISIDASGKVTDVDVIKSSGTVDIDQPCQAAVYNWWFEPTRDKSGRPVADVLTFTIRFE